MSPSIQAIVFDAYGTLFDVHSVVEKCETYFPGYGSKISEIWRQKQLEYTWLRSLMGRYEDFWKVTDDGLVYALKKLGLDTSDETRESILHEYLSLCPYTEVPEALNRLTHKPLAILSNGSPKMLNDMVEHAGLSGNFAHVISVDSLKVFKPFMGVYQLAVAKLGVPREQIAFVSSNSWDAVGAKVFGFQVCWINRIGNTFDEMQVKPDVVVNNLNAFVDWVIMR